MRMECGSRTRRRPKRTGLCRGKDAEVGKIGQKTDDPPLPFRLWRAGRLQG
jgi:hypothetical protein